jgi:hypothetical protein
LRLSRGLRGGEPEPAGPTPAGVYDSLLGGAGSFAADREMAKTLMSRDGCPSLAAAAKTNRRFMLKAVTWAASRGIRQFIDGGCGLPLHPSVHETARAVNPGARVAYADRDPAVVSHCRALYRGEGLAVIAGDVADPAALLANPALLEVIDLSRPVCLLLGATLSCLDAQAARGAVAGFSAAMAPGSCVAVSCVSFSRDLGHRMREMFSAAGQWRNHTGADMESFFAAGGLDLACGRVTDVSRWPMLPDAGGERAVRVLGGIGSR